MSEPCGSEIFIKRSVIKLSIRSIAHERVFSVLFSFDQRLEFVFVNCSRLFSLCSKNSYEGSFLCTEREPPPGHFKLLGLMTYRASRKFVGDLTCGSAIFFVSGAGTNFCEL